MYAMLRTYSGAPGLAAELQARTDEVRRVIGEIDGFRAYYLVSTPDGAVSISVFDTEDGTAQSAQAAAAYLRENLPDFAGSPPQVSSGEVVIAI